MFNKVIVLMFAIIVCGSAFEAYRVVSMVNPTLQAYDAQMERERCLASLQTRKSNGCKSVTLIAKETKQAKLIRSIARQ